MAYALYLYKDLGKGLRLEILRKDWTGAATEIRAMGTTPISLVGLDNKGSDVLEPIIKSTLNIDIKDLGEIDFRELFTSYATRFKVSVKQNGVQVWGGYVTPDSYSQDLAFRTSINIVARDNLGQLDQLDFDYFNEENGWLVKISDLITKAQEKIEWVMDPIEWYAQQNVASDGTPIKDSYISTRIFAKDNDSSEATTWYEALETVLSSIGQQLRYVGNNKTYIVNVADLYEVGSIGGQFAFDYAIGGAAGMEITPSWRQLTVKQDYGLIDNAIDYEQDEKYLEYIVLEAGPSNLSLYRNKFFKYQSEAGTTAGILEITNSNSNIQSVVQYDGPVFYNNFQITNAKQSGTTYYNAFLFDMFRSAGCLYFPLNVASGNSFVLQFTVYNNVHRIALRDDDEEDRTLEPISTEALTSSLTGDIHIYIRMAVTLVVGSTVYYMNGDSWSTSENVIEFDVAPSEEANDTSTELTVNILNVPYNGELHVVMYAPLVKRSDGVIDLPNAPAPDVSPFNQSPNVVVKDFVFHTLAYQDMSKAPGKFEIIGVGNEDGNTKEEIDISFGEIPVGIGDSVTFAGGLFDGSVGHKALTGWHRTDNKGGVLHLSELVGRGFTHHFCAFRNVNDEKTGGTVVSGTVKFTDTSFFSKRFTIGSDTYIVNAATMDMLAGTAEVELRQVVPYLHQENVYEQNEISGGGNSAIGGGSSTSIAWGTPRRAVRLYELSEATTDEAKQSYLLVDKDGNETAKKFPASKIMSLADWFGWDESNNAVYCKFNLYSVGYVSQIGPAEGGGSGGSGTMYHDQLEHLDWPNQHPIEAITGLQEALNGKASADHVHSWASLTDKPTTLSGFGITDGVDKDSFDTHVRAFDTHVNSSAHLTTGQRAVLAMLSVDDDGNLKIDGNAFTTGWLAQLGAATGEGGTGGSGTMYHDQLQHLDWPNQHPIEAITGLQAALDTKLNASSISEWALQTSKPSYTWAEISGKPSAFTPSAHTHLMNDVTGLASALAGKLDTSHASDTTLHLTAGQRAVLSMLSVDTDGNLKIDGNAFTTGWLAQLGAATGEGGTGGGGTLYHDQLEHLDYPDQHPIAAIVGLQSALNGKASTALVTTSASGLMSATDKAKLDGIAAGANNYVLPIASASVLGGVRIGSRLSIASGVLSANAQAWSEITGKPTTLSGYGITDAMTASAINTALAGKLGKAEKAADSALFDGYGEAKFWRKDRKTVDLGAGLANLPVESGSYIVYSNVWTGSAFVFNAAASNSGLAFYRPGGGNYRPQLIIGLDSTPTKWTNLGELVVKSDLTSYLPLTSGTLTNYLTINSGTNYVGLVLKNNYSGLSNLGGIHVGGNNDLILRAYPNGGLDLGHGNDLRLRYGGNITWNGSTIWHAGNDGANSGLDADLLDGRHASEFWGHFLTTIDASALSEDYYYPVTILVPSAIRMRISVIVALNSGTKPSWSTHANGFSCRFSEEVSGDGWGTISPNRLILDSTYKFADKNPIGEVWQMTNSNNEVIAVRGGGKYFFYTTRATTITLRTTSFTSGGQTAAPKPVSSLTPAPHKSGAGLVGLSTLYCNSIVIGGHTITWDSTNNALKIDGNVYTTGSITQLKS